MSTKTIGILAGALCALGSAYAEGTRVDDGDVVTVDGYKVRHVPAGKTVECWGTGAATFTASDKEEHTNINMNNGSSGIYADTKQVILLDDNATLRIISPKNHAIWNVIIVTNGCHATIEAPNDKSLTFNESVAIFGDGTLTVKNASSKIQFYHSTYWPVLDLKNLRFDGGDVSKIEIRPSRIVSLPEGWTTDRNSNNITTDWAYLIGENITAGWTAQKFPTTRMRIANPLALGDANTTIPAGYEFALTPIKFPSAAERTVAYYIKNAHATFTVTKRADTTYANDFTFADATSTLTLNYDYLAFDTHYTGKLTGAGTLRATSKSGTASAPTKAYFAGDAADFTGTITTEYTGTEAGICVDFVLSNDVAQATVAAGEHGQVTFAAETTPATRTAAALGTGAYVAANGVTVAAAGLSGTINLVSGAFQLPAIGDDGVRVLKNAAASVTFGGVAEPTDALVAVSLDGTQKMYGAPTDGVYDVAAFEAAVPFQHLAISVPAGKTVSGATADTRLTLKTGETATVAADDGDVTASLAGNGTFALSEPNAYDAEAWTNDVTYWYDFANTANLRLIADHGDEFVKTYGYDVDPDYTNETWTTAVGKSKTKSSTIDGVSRQWPMVERWVDPRYPDPTFPTLMNGFLYNDSTKPTYYTSPYCVLATNMYATSKGTLSYLDISTGRLPFGDTPRNCNQGVGKVMQHVIMVWNSNNGLCKALVGTFEGALGRAAGLDQPFVTNITDSAFAALNLRTNGVAVTDRLATPKAGWQIVAIDLHGLKFKGVGFNKTYNDGQRDGKYGEILLFEDRLDEISLLKAEMYLAKKWELPYDFTTAEARVAAVAKVRREQDVAAFTNTVSAIGSGTVVAGKRTLTLDGNFTGTLDLQGGKLILADGQLPYTEAQVAQVSADKRLFWMDPNDTATCTHVRMKDPQDTGDRTIRTIADKVNGLEHPYVMSGRSNRMPSLWQEERGVGPERGWLDFNNNPDFSDVSGNMIRLFQRPEGFVPTQDLDDENAVALPVQTAFIVQDSVRGGGNPLIDNTTGNGCIGTRTSGKTTDTIWKNGTGGTCTEFSGGENRLNGAVVDQSKGFGGKPEVFTVRGTAPITNTAETYAWLWIMGNFANSDDAKKGEIIGETLLYSGALADGDVAGIEAYLMGKWLGYLPTGFADARQATVTGSGAIEVSAAEKMPLVASDFAGTIAVGGETGAFTMTVDPTTGAVTGALAFDDATVTLPPTVTLNVKMTETPAKSVSVRRYLLARAAGVTSWNLVKGANVPAKAKLEVEDDEVYLVLPPNGFIIEFR